MDDGHWIVNVGPIELDSISGESAKFCLQVTFPGTLCLGSLFAVTDNLWVELCRHMNRFTQKVFGAHVAISTCPISPSSPTKH